MSQEVRLDKAAERLLAKTGIRPRRNSSLFDPWSIVHLVTGITFGWIMTPFVALIIMVLWGTAGNLASVTVCGTFRH
jgi:hypothetical protein